MDKVVSIIDQMDTITENDLDMYSVGLLCKLQFAIHKLQATVFTKIVGQIGEG